MTNKPTDCDDFVERFIGAQARLYGYIVTFVPARADADELFQQTSLVLWQKRDEFDTSRDFLPWACGIAHNLIRNHLKRNRRQGVWLSDELIERLAELRHSARARLDGQVEQLGRCLDQLPAEQRELLELCYLGEDSIGAVARQRQIDPAALYKRLDRIRWTLVDCIQAGRRQEGGR